MGFYSILDENCIPVQELNRDNLSQYCTKDAVPHKGLIIRWLKTVGVDSGWISFGKLIHYPITFVVKQDISSEEAMEKIYNDATVYYNNQTIDDYMNCFEEIITIPRLKSMLEENIYNGFLPDMVDEFITQCKVEYNFE